MRKFSPLLALCFWSSASAQHGGEAIPVPSVSEDLLPIMLKLAVAVIVIVALIYLTMLFIRKFSLGRAGILGGKGSLEIIERSYFAPKKFVCLMRVGTKVFLVGVSESNINLVADVSDQEFPVLSKRKSKEKTPGFKSYLQQAKTHFSTLVSKV